MIKRWFFLIATHCQDHVGNKCLLCFVSNLSDPLPVDAIAHTAHLLTRTKSGCLGVARGNLSKIWECVEAELRWFAPQHCCQRGCSLRLQSFSSNAGGFAWNVVFSCSSLPAVLGSTCGTGNPGGKWTFLLRSKIGPSSLKGRFAASAGERSRKEFLKEKASLTLTLRLTGKQAEAALTSLCLYLCSHG